MAPSGRTLPMPTPARSSSPGPVRRSFSLACALPLATSAVALVACSSFGTSDADGGAGTLGPTPTATPTGSAARTCFDAENKPTTSCPVPFSPTECTAPDANLACATIVTEELRVQPSSSSANSGNCVHIVVRNDCASTMYSYTCIEFTADGKVRSQCWQSTTSPGKSVDVGQCQATGRFSRVSSLSSGGLTVLKGQCPPPSPL